VPADKRGAVFILAAALKRMCVESEDTAVRKMSAVIDRAGGGLQMEAVDIRCIPGEEAKEKPEWLSDFEDVDGRIFRFTRPSEPL